MIAPSHDGVGVRKVKHLTFSLLICEQTMSRLIESVPAGILEIRHGKALGFLIHGKGRKAVRQSGWRLLPRNKSVKK